MKYSFLLFTLSLFLISATTAPITIENNNNDSWLFMYEHSSANQEASIENNRFGIDAEGNYYNQRNDELADYSVSKWNKSLKADAIFSLDAKAITAIKTLIRQTPNFKDEYKSDGDTESKHMTKYVLLKGTKAQEIQCFDDNCPKELSQLRDGILSLISDKLEELER